MTGSTIQTCQNKSVTSTIGFLKTAQLFSIILVSQRQNKAGLTFYENPQPFNR